MQELINEIKAISSTLEGLDLPPTISNMDKLLGCQQHLSMVRERLQKMMDDEKKEKEEKHADADAE